MYGMVNSAVREHVIERYGAAAWDEVRAAAGTPDRFEPMQPYPDALTYGLVGSVVSRFGVAAPTLLHDLGEFWIERIAKPHYAELMSATGTSFVAFVKNLDHMHARIRVTFPDYRPPSFRVLTLADDRLQVDYYSEREGLLPFVEGLFTGLAAHINTKVSFEHVADESHGMPCKRMLVTVVTKPA